VTHIGSASDPESAWPEWPIAGLTADVRPALEAMLELGPVALATVISVTPSGPRPPGTHMVVGAMGVEGFLSGGCIEADVAGHARACLADGQPRRLVYGEGGPWPDIQLACGARLEVLVEAIQPGDPAALALFDLRRRRRPAVWVSDGLRRACAEETPEAIEGGITARHAPTARLIVVGGDPIALALCALAVQTGFKTLLVRPRGPLTPPPLMGVGYDRRAPAQALAAWGLDRWTAVAACSHDDEIDHETLMASLPSEAGYVGLLGARNRLDGRLKALRDLGLNTAALARLKAPIGIDLGGKAPFEIALSVVAQLVAARFGKAL